MNWDELVQWATVNSWMAAWVQAAGAILAILAATVIASQQTRRDQRFRREDAKQRALAHAGRLYMTAKEFVDVVNSAVNLEAFDDYVAADARVALAVDRMLNRLNTNFDDDHDVARVIQIAILRSAMVGLHVLLTTSEHLTVAEREGQVKIYKSLAPGILEECDKLVKKVHTQHA